MGRSGYESIERGANRTVAHEAVQIRRRYESQTRNMIDRMRTQIVNMKGDKGASEKKQILIAKDEYASTDSIDFEQIEITNPVAKTSAL